MKMMPKQELISMLKDGADNEMISRDFINYLFEYYGDDYFVRDSGWELCNKNEKREERLRELVN